VGECGAHLLAEAATAIAAIAEVRSATNAPSVSPKRR
jgi:hypothetical protein